MTQPDDTPDLTAVVESIGHMTERMHLAAATGSVPPADCAPYLDAITSVVTFTAQQTGVDLDLLMGGPTTEDWVRAHEPRQCAVRLANGRGVLYGVATTEADGTLTFTPQPIGEVERP